MLVKGGEEEELEFGPFVEVCLRSWKLQNLYASRHQMYKMFNALIFVPPFSESRASVEWKYTSVEY